MIRGFSWVLDQRWIKTSTSPALQAIQYGFDSASFLSILAQVVAVLCLSSTIFYSPFAKQWKTSLAVPFLLAFLWALIRLAMITGYGEAEDIPLFGILFAPFGYLAWAALARLLVRALLGGVRAERVRRGFSALWRTHVDRVRRRCY
jgi:hypothetical protein